MSEPDAPQPPPLDGGTGKPGTPMKWGRAFLVPYLGLCGVAFFVLSTVMFARTFMLPKLEYILGDTGIAPASAFLGFVLGLPRLADPVLFSGIVGALVGAILIYWIAAGSRWQRFYFFAAKWSMILLVLALYWSVANSLLLVFSEWQRQTEKQAKIAGMLGYRHAFEKEVSLSRNIRDQFPVEEIPSGEPLEGNPSSFYIHILTELARSHRMEEVRRASLATLVTDWRLHDDLPDAAEVLDLFNEETGEKLGDLAAVRKWVIGQEDASWRALPLYQRVVNE